MKILFLHGWHSKPGGVKPAYLAAHRHEVLNPALPDDDFDAAVRIAQAEFDQQRPDVVVGSSRGGAVAMNLQTGDVPLILLCPAWKRWGTATTVKPGTAILHSPADEVIPIGETRELIWNSNLPLSPLLITGQDHRLTDPQSLELLRSVIEQWPRIPQKEKSPVREVGVPPRFGVGTLMFITALFALLFAGMRSLGFPPAAFSFVGVFYAAVGFGQMLLFRGQRPRRASILVGAWFFPGWFFAADVYQSATSGNSSSLLFRDSVAYLAVNVVVGAVLGYLVGVTIAGPFLVLEKLRDWRVKRKRETEREGHYAA